MTVGITGKYCSGKSNLAKIFVAHGFEEIDVDMFGHKALEVHQERIVQAFSNFDILDQNTQKIDRRILSSIVFSNKKHLKTLESLVHPWIRDEIRTKISQNTDKHYVICAALLHKLELHSLCNAIIIVKISFLTHLIRARKRDGLSFKKILQILNAQRNLITKKMLKSTSSNTDTLCVRGIYCDQRYKDMFISYFPDIHPNA